MNRTIEQWQKCDPKMMADNQSRAAIFYALRDAKDDILKLYRENAELKRQIEAKNKLELMEECGDEAKW